MSLTPDSTADSAMKSASTDAAISRASVVLPTPGGPQRIIECMRPEASAEDSGMPGPTRWRWPITSDSDAGRSRSASGACAGAGPARLPCGVLRAPCPVLVYPGADGAPPNRSAVIAGQSALIPAAFTSFV